MGDIADMMLDGTLCEGCGVYLDLAGSSFPRRCPGCLDDETLTIPSFVRPSQNKVSCPKCKRRVKKVGLSHHMRDKHGTKA